ncbi:poly-gamma-glutamate hydrolase family protein [Saccharopolyspora tripterygii]
MISRTATTATAALLALAVAPAAEAEDTYADYADLAAHETEGVDYRRAVRDGSTDVVHIAIHGGGIERPTTELADSAATSGDHGFGTFEGIKPSGNSVLHITSTHFDEPQISEAVAGSTYTVSWHGAKGDEPTTYVGGLDTELRDAVREELREEGFDAPDALPDGLTGEDPDNIANRNTRGKGVQLELTRAQRDALVKDGVPTAEFDDYVAAVERAVSRR